MKRLTSGGYATRIAVLEDFDFLDVGQLLLDERHGVSGFHFVGVEVFGAAQCEGFLAETEEVGSLS